MPQWKRWIGALALLGLVLWAAFALGRLSAASRAAQSAAVKVQPVVVATGPDTAPTRLYAHNLLLQKGAHFRIYIRWLRGELLRTRRDVNPSFDAPQSFVLQIDKGVISVRLADLSDFLNSGTGTGSSLKHISLQSANGQLELHGTVHKLIPVPVKVTGLLSPMPDGRVNFHVQGISMLKVPMKGLLGLFHIELDDLVASPNVPGVQIVENDIHFDTEKLLPAPHIHGQITAVVTTPDQLKIIYGNAGDDEGRLNEWHNFFRFTGGTLDFGKLTMHDVDLTMIDASNDPWFDLDLVNYQAQIVNAYTRMTAQAGMEIYMPDLSDVKSKEAAQAVTLQWLRNRNSALPSDVPIKDGKLVKP